MATVAAQNAKVVIFLRSMAVACSVFRKVVGKYWWQTMSDETSDRFTVFA